MSKVSVKEKNVQCAHLNGKHITYTLNVYYKTVI